MKKPPLSPEQQARLDEELAKQKATQERIQDLATNSIMAWMMLGRHLAMRIVHEGNHAAGHASAHASARRRRAPS